MKIYTKKGDFGKTSIIGESNIDKHNIRIESYGTIDELNSYIGLLRSFHHQKFDSQIQELVFIQDTLFSIGASLATKKNPKLINSITENHVTSIEVYIDRLESGLSQLKSFILPGGDIWTSYAQISRSICRRAERRLTLLNKNEKVNEIILKFINRLSDYLFVLARHLSEINNTPEIKWGGK